MSNRSSHFVRRVQTSALRPGGRIRLKVVPGAPVNRCAAPGRGGNVVVYSGPTCVHPSILAGSGRGWRMIRSIRQAPLRLFLARRRCRGRPHDRGRPALRFPRPCPGAGGHRDQGRHRREPAGEAHGPPGRGWTRFGQPHLDGVNGPECYPLRGPAPRPGQSRCRRVRGDRRQRRVRPPATPTARSRPGAATYTG